MKPPRSILDKAFDYTPAARTDLKRTFARIRREQKAHKDATAAKITKIIRRIA